MYESQGWRMGYKSHAQTLVPYKSACFENYLNGFFIKIFLLI